MKALAGFAGSSEQRYEIVRKIAAGGMATVYLGRGVGALGFERPVAIKACHPHLLGDEPGDRAQSVLDEARVAALIRHPNVVATLDVTLTDGAVMIVMEYVEGLTVAGLVKAAARDDRVVPASIALRIAEDALAGLHAAHELRGDDGRLLEIVHRDVSPQNVIVGVDGFAKLADFGVFKGDTRTARVTATGEVKGKLGYVAPEVYQGQPATRRSDVYALGVVLWELCAGRRLFDEATDAATMARVLAGAVPALSSLRADLPFELDGVLARALAVDPAERFATAEDFSRALEALPVAAASTRQVAQHVRDAMARGGAGASAGPSASASAGASASASAGAGSGSSLAPTSAAADDELRTPNELVTPVQAKVRARVRTVAVATACLALAALAGSVATLRSAGSAGSVGPAAGAAGSRGGATGLVDQVPDRPQDHGIVGASYDSVLDRRPAAAGTTPSASEPSASDAGPATRRGAPARAPVKPRAPAARPTNTGSAPRPAATVFDPAEL